MTVRPYDASRDRAELRALNIEQQDFSRSLEPSWPEGVKAVEDYVAYLMKECETRDGCVLLAEWGGQIAGFICAVTTMGPGSPDDPATFAWIHDVYVRPTHRRKGVATALMAAAEAFVRERGARELRLGVIDRNQDARAMYRGRGFRDYLRVLTKPLDA